MVLLLGRRGGVVRVGYGSNGVGVHMRPRRRNPVINADGRRSMEAGRGDSVHGMKGPHGRGPRKQRWVGCHNGPGHGDRSRGFDDHWNGLFRFGSGDGCGFFDGDCHRRSRTGRRRLALVEFSGKSALGQGTGRLGAHGLDGVQVHGAEIVGSEKDTSLTLNRKER